MNRTLRFIASLAAGCFVAVVIARAGVLAARAFWPEYAAAEPLKAYTLAMLVSRLSVGALATAGAARATMFVAGDNGRAAWTLGTLFLAISLPHHVFYVWSDYPVWYHGLYLGYLVPVAGLSARVGRAWSNKARDRNVAA